MARARNNVAKLPFEQRMVVCEMLSDGATYDEIRSKISSNNTLHNKSFLAYSKGIEYSDFIKAKNQSRKRFVAKRINAFTVKNQSGTDAIISLTEATLAEQLQQFLADNALETDISELKSAAQILRNLQNQQLEHLRIENTELKAQIERLKTSKSEENNYSAGLSDNALQKMEEAAKLL